VAVLLGAFAVFATRTITPEEAYRLVDWRVLVLIGCMLAVGDAMEGTGTAKFLAGELARLVGDANPLWMVSGVFVLTVALTQPMSNQAAAVVVLPVAVQTALALGLNPRTFAVMVAVAASTSYLTPLDPSCLMVYGPGRYRFIDFLKVGGLLTFVVFLISILVVPAIWPLRNVP
jgi:di/tricarboxylate transporter